MNDALLFCIIGDVTTLTTPPVIRWENLTHDTSLLANTDFWLYNKNALVF